MNEILQTMITVSMIAFLILSVASGLVFLLALDEKKVAINRKIVVTFFFNYWSKKNVVASCKPSWVSLVLIMRLLVFVSLCAILFLAVMGHLK